MSGTKSKSGGLSPARPAWKPASTEAVARVAQVAERFAGAERRKMFGYPCLFLNGNMVAGVHADDVFLRLAPADREAFLRLDGAHLLEPMPGRPMREYVVAPTWLLGREAELAAWIDRAEEYAATLPPKLKVGK